MSFQQLTTIVPWIAGGIVAFGLVNAILVWKRWNLALSCRKYPCDVVLVLGGDPEREISAGMALKTSLPQIPIYLSSPDDDRRFRRALNHQEFELDTRATDTVTNFTTLGGILSNHQFRHVQVMTSDYHVPRAEIIAKIVLSCGYGMAVTMHSLKSTEEGDAWRSQHQNLAGEVRRARRDAIRAIMFLFTGLDGSSIGRFIHPRRFRHSPTKAR